MRIKNLISKHGYWFTGYIEGVQVEGRINVEKDYNKFSESYRIYFCQDKKNGARCRDENMFDYDYSWVVRNVTEKYTEESDVHNVKLFKKKPKEFTYLKNNVTTFDWKGYQTSIYPKLLIKVGCTIVPIKIVREVVKLLGRKNLAAVKVWDVMSVLPIKVILMETTHRRISVYKGVGAMVTDTGWSLLGHDEIKKIAKLVGA